MKKINWKVRFRNKTWLAGFISQTLLIIQAIIFGLEGLHVIDIDMEQAEQWQVFVMGIVDLFLAYMAYLGIVTDPTTEGVTDSARALKRSEPLPEAKKNEYWTNQ
ncbi:phage holin [Neobacillus sp. C211]|uniref:phage holin n=1 Tax=unclassified Neobacillus TaxID=2675272 RepID=UPI003979C9B2